MQQILTSIIDRIALEGPQYAESLHKYVGGMDDSYHCHAEAFFGRYRQFIEEKGLSLDFGVKCYLKLCASMAQERLDFLRTGQYSSKSFEEVNRRVYSNPEVMQYHMHGLVFAQFLWPEQYRRFEFFSKHLKTYAGGARTYLEIGGGHALYITEAARLLDSCSEFDLVDISPTSLDLAKGIARNSRIGYHLMDICDFPAHTQYDFITMGEVLEHLERPRDLLLKVRDLLSPGGRAYITTPVNAPTLDHIYLFRNVGEIRDLLQSSGFAIEREVSHYAADLPQRRAEALKVALMFGAFVRKN